MTHAQRFCSVENRRLGEPLTGNAGADEPHLLLTWPRRKWADHVFIARDMPDGVAERLTRLRDNGFRVLLIDRRECDHDRRRILAPAEGAAYEAGDDDLPTLLDALLQGGAIDPRWRRSPLSATLLLCCTHGRIDRCCAKFGHAAYRAIAAQAAAYGRRFDVWESTHVGGCRLAAKVVSLPRLRKYGRVLPEQVPALLAAEADDRPFVPCYRGRPGLNPLEQCAEVAALEWLEQAGQRGRTRVQPTRQPKRPGVTAVTVFWTSGLVIGELRVWCRGARITGAGNCKALHRSECNLTKLAWWPTAVRAVRGTTAEAL